MYQLVEENNIVTGWIYGWVEGWEDAPDGFNAENADEWVKVEGEWIQDAEQAQQIREALENAE